MAPYQAQPRRATTYYTVQGPVGQFLLAAERARLPLRRIGVVGLCAGAFACAICQAACPVANCIVEEKDRDGRMVCAVRADLCIGCGLCVTLGNPTAPQIREFGCPPDYDAINMMPFDEVVKLLIPQAEPAAAKA